MSKIDIKQIRGASQGSILFLGTNSVVEDFSNLNWNQTDNTFYINGNIQIVDGNQQDGYILTSDVNGLATWTQSFSADNGLSIDNKTIILGGTLSQNTTIEGDGNDLIFQNLEYILFTSSVFDVEVNGLISLDSGTGSVQILADDSISLFSDSSVNISTNNDLSINFNDGFVKDISGASHGLIYKDDYSYGFLTHSLVDKNYVDNLINSSTDNGLSIDNGNIVLGGTLSQTTTIEGDGNDLNLLNLDNFLVTSESSFDVNVNDGLIILDSGDDGDIELYSGGLNIVATNSVDILTNDIDIQTVDFNLDFIGSATVSVGGELEGLVYSATPTEATDLTLIHKQYVDDVIEDIQNDLDIGTFTVELIDETTVDFYAPGDLKINDYDVIFGSASISIEVNESSYTISNLIEKGDKITVTSDDECVVNLNVKYE